MTVVIALVMLAAVWMPHAFGSALEPLRLGRPVAAPAIVFVSRNPIPGAAHGVPGLGPRYRTIAVGGRLMVRSVSGRVYELLARGSFYDVADPAVSYDGRRIAFAATVAPDSAWRIWAVGADGRGLVAVTRTDRVIDLSRFGVAAARFERYDDFDPTWLPDGRIVFASTRYPQQSETAGVLASNLFAVRADGTGLQRISSERNGAEEPSVDPRTGFVVFTRWWSSRFLASDRASSGVTTDRTLAVPADDVNLWQAIATRPDGQLPQLAGGYPRERPLTMAYQPVILDDGTLVGVAAEHPGLVPDPGKVAVCAFPGGFAPPVWLPQPAPHAPAVVPGTGAQVVACAPAAIGGRRIVLSCDARGAGDFGLFVVSLDGGPMAPLVDLPGTAELDAALLAPRRRPPVIEGTNSKLPNDAPPSDPTSFVRRGETFRFDCLSVFANAPVDAPIPDAPPIQRDLRIRFFAALARPAAEGGDTLVLVRESPVYGGGAVHEEDLPADTPMFEQLIDAHGHVIRSASGPAHVPGFNVARFGTGTKCVGCHLGHSVIPVGRSAYDGKRINAAPSARATASSSAPGTAGPQAAVDRRTLGPPSEVAWISDGPAGQKLRLEWTTAIEMDSLILYALRVSSPNATNLRVSECRLDFFLNGRAVGHQVVRTELSPLGTRVACGGVRVDAVEFHPTRATGKVLGRECVAIAEIETRARLAED